MFQNLRSDSSALPVSILSLLLVIGFTTLILQAGCNPDANSIGSRHSVGTNPTGTNHGAHREALNQTRYYTTVDRDSADAPRINIGSFNIKQFGTTKMSRPNVVDVLVDIARRFDILAIQELRDVNQRVIPEFLDLINSDGSRYAAAVGPRQGYIANGRTTTYFEQTVFIYDTTKVELIAEAYAAYDRHRTMYRPPFVGHFRSIEVDPAEAFQFVLMNVHIAPKRAHLEFEALREIIGGIYPNHPGEDDFILLGDLNEEPHRYQAYAWMNDQVAALPSELKTNTNQTEAYDNIVFDAVRTSEFMQASGVLDLMSEYGLTLADAQRVSDHMPVWATFSAFEAPSAAITRGDQGLIR